MTPEPNPGRSGRPISHGKKHKRSRVKEPLANRVVRVLLLLLLVLVPWIEGDANLLVRFALHAAVIGALTIWLWQLWQFNRGGSLLLVFAVPLAFAILMGLIQYIPLPNQVLFSVAPRTANLRERLLPAVLESTQEPTQSFTATAPASTISLYPAATWTTIGEFSLYFSTFMLACRRFRTNSSQRWLSGVALVVGGTIAFYGIARDLSTRHSRAADGVIATPRGGFGPFADRDAAGAFLSLCLAPALGLVLQTWRRQDGRTKEGQAPEADSVVSQAPAPALAQISEIVGKITPRLLATGAGTVVIVVGVLATGSHAAVAATTGAAAITLAIALSIGRRSHRVWIPGSCAVAGLLLVMLFSSNAAWSKRSVNPLVSDPDTPARGRHHLAALGDFWVLGSGLGTYRYVHSMYEEFPPLGELAHAENEWIETMIEAGIWGLLALVALVVLLAYAAWKITMHPGRARRSPFAWSGIFLIAGQFILSLLDSSHRSPANALWLSMVMGSIAGGAITIWESKTAKSRRSRSEGAKNPGVPLLAACLIVLCSLGALEVLNLRSANQALAAAQSTLVQRGSEDPPDFEDAISRLRVASQNRWSDVRLHQEIAECYFARYRAETGLEPEDAGRTELVVEPSTENRDGAMLRNLVPAVRHLLCARQSCPLLPRVYLHLAELRFLMATSWSDLDYLECANRLAPADPELLFRVGRLHWKAGRTEQAEADWNRSLMLDPSRRDAIRAFMEQKRPDPSPTSDIGKRDE